MLDFGFKGRQARPKSRIGLDIGSHSIKLVELSGAADKLSLVSFRLERVSGSSIEAITESIKKTAFSLSLSAGKVCIGVAGPSVIVRLISMPQMSDEELAGAVRFEAEKFIPFDINDCVLDFQVIATKPKEKPGAIEVLLAAVKKDYVLQKIRAVEDAGLVVTAVDVDILAVTNAFLRNFPSQEQSRTIALIGIGASCTDLSILKGGVPFFVRQISIGSNDCSAAIAKNMGLDADSAESLKTSPQERLSEVINCTKPVLANLIDEIKLSFGYYENQSGRSIDEVYLAGGGSAIIGLEDAFKEILGSKPICWDPFQFLTMESGSMAALDERTRTTFGVAIGLALR